MSSYDSEYRKRFLNRARAEGFKFSREAEANRSAFFKLRPVLLSAQYGLGLAALIVAALLGVRAYHWKTSQKAAVAQLDASRQKTSELERLNGRLRDEVIAAERQRGLIAKQLADLSAEISADSRARAVALARIQGLQQSLEDATAAARNLAESADAGVAERKALNGQLQQQEDRIGQMQDENRKLRLLYTTGEAAVHTEEQRSEKLAAQLKEQTSFLGQENRLLGADRDVRDLMGARKLHVVDVYDANGEGNNKRAFGRVFYTEGKSLIFYAFDLGNPYHADAKFSFVGWGATAAAAGPAKELGIFYVDDATERRWVLKIDNPEVLREINAVFVTVEPARGSKRPTGQRLLYAYLNTEANHP